jgi:hypothetical protein
MRAQNIIGNEKQILRWRGRGKGRENGGQKKKKKKFREK